MMSGAWLVGRAADIMERARLITVGFLGAVTAATAYWNKHKHPFVWGRKRRHRPARRSGVAVVPNAAST